ncbi:MAG: glycine/sarcosine/betaine reductase complex component C subunit beta [Clostridium sp.]
MGGYPVLKGASYVLAITPDMVLHNGTTQTTERIVNPDSEYLKQIKGHLRSFEDAVSYVPNQVYIGNATPADLAKVEFPYYDKKWEGAGREGRYGQIMPQDEFYGLIQICDVFDLVKLEKGFAADVKIKLAAQNLLTEDQLAILDKNESTAEDIKALVDDEHAEALYQDDVLVGAVKRAHDVDVNLSAHVMLENLVTKASNVLSLIELVKKTDMKPEDVDYVIDCCEEACGDMNQRGGGNFAKASAEVAGFVNATGSDVRGFCAAPTHAMVHAAALVKAGIFKNVVVTAGGCTAKLGMNGKNHVEKGIPILEDAVAGFSALISADDGTSPQIRTDIVGYHTIGTGSAPQNVISALVTAPLEAAGLKIVDIDKYAPEMQNPDITKPAGAGDVPEANYKMIAALGVKRGELQRGDIAAFVKEHGMVGWAPTQGHIPSGVPYLGALREEVLAGETKRAMIIGKGSLFLGRMTNLFDGISFVVQANDQSAAEEGGSFDEGKVKSMIGEAMRAFAEGLLEKGN